MTRCSVAPVSKEKGKDLFLVNAEHFIVPTHIIIK